MQGLTLDPSHAARYPAKETPEQAVASALTTILSTGFAYLIPHGGE